MEECSPDSSSTFNPGRICVYYICNTRRGDKSKPVSTATHMRHESPNVDVDADTDADTKGRPQEKRRYFLLGFNSPQRTEIAVYTIYA